jgi:hypothetical protein
LPGRKCSVSDVAGGAGIGTGQLARTLRARYRPQAASARLPEEAAVASNAMLATARLDHIVHHLALALGGRSAASYDLGPAKAGSFAFVSPIIAVLVGVIAAGETVSPLSIAGMAVMLVAAGACLYSDELEALFARIAGNGTGVVQKLVRPALDEIR